VYVATADRTWAGHNGRLARGWRNFRRWRRARPFWGGYYLILSGLEIFVSGNMQLGALEVHFGPEGFQSYVIPLMLVLCGLLTWFTPGQRLFYGILGSLVAVYSLIGVNLGGFIVGMILGVVGGALTIAWTPVRVPAPAAVDNEARMEDARTEEQPTVDEGLAPWFGEPSPGPVGPGGAGWADEYRPPAPGPDVRRRLRFLALGVLVAAAVTAGGMPLASSRPALAAPCPPGAIDAADLASAVGSVSPTRPPTRTSPPAAGPAAAGKAPGTGSAKGGAPARTPPPPSPSPSAEPDDDDDRGGGFFGWLGRLFGGGKRKADPQPSASASTSPGPTGSQSPTSPATTKPPGTTPSGSRSPSRPPSPSPSCLTGGPARVLAPAPGQPRIAERPSQMLADRLTQSGLSFDGVVDLPIRGGTVRALKFSLRRSVATNFELRVPTGRLIKSLRTPELTVEGNVSFFATRFSGRLFGLIPVTFTPDSPPPIILPELLFTAVDIQLAFVRADTLRSPTLVVRYLPD
jgi:hypothetical protein